VQPTRNGYINAVQVYPFATGALYQVYAAPGQVTDVALQEGEQLVGSEPVAAGDTVRWIIGDTESGTGLKPTRSELISNLVIIPTDALICWTFVPRKGPIWPRFPGNIRRIS
jgi:type IV secretion system protein VirB9